MTGPARPPASRISRIRLAEPDIGEEECAAVREAMLSGVLTNGPRTKAFEDAFARLHQVDHAVALANGTLALAAIYIGVGIGPGDEVIVPSMTFISSATSVLHAGARPVFADIRPDTFTIDPQDVARRVTPRTRAILAVHYGGQAADLEELQAVADDAGALLIEDAAQSHGSTYRGRPVGGFGTAAMFSMTPTKNITTGEGGVVTTDDGALASRLRLLRNHGQTAPYQHSLLGFNWRMTEMQAAMGEVQLGRLEGILAVKRANAMWMSRALAGTAGVQSPAALPDRDHAYMLYTLLVDHPRDAMLDFLRKAGIEARVYFPPAHRQPIFSDQPCTLPVTDEIAPRMLSIPFHARLRQAQLEELASCVMGAAEAGAVTESSRP